MRAPVGMPATAATFDWAAPEQIVGLPLDPRADVYSLALDPVDGARSYVGYCNSVQWFKVLQRAPPP